MYAHACTHAIRLIYMCNSRNHHITHEIHNTCRAFSSAHIRRCLRPLLSAPSERSRDTASLFDYQLFLKHCPASEGPFYQYLFDTQIFNAFIEQRSFAHAESVSLAFFDECTEKVQGDRCFVPGFLPFPPPSLSFLSSSLPLFPPLCSSVFLPSSLLLPSPNFFLCSAAARFVSTTHQCDSRCLTVDFCVTNINTNL